MNAAKAKIYADRINNVIDYINSHLYEDLSVEQLSQVANFSKYHFHRQFSEYTGINVFKLIQLMRLKRASHQLVFVKNYRIIDIALDAGFENPESFSRAFKKAFGQTPSAFRKNPDWKPWLEKYQFPITGGRSNMQVQLVEFNETKVAVLEHRGAPEFVYDSVSTFIEWRKANKLSPKVSETYNIFYDDPNTTEPEKYRVDICASVKEDVKGNPQGIVTKVIPGGRCALLRHTGSSDNLGDSIRNLYSQWLPSSGEELRDFPCFVHRVNLFPEAPEHELITDIYLPLK